MEKFIEKVTPAILKSLPADVSSDKFIQELKITLHLNPSLLKNSSELYTVVVKCAIDGLLPNGKEASIFIIGNKVQYRPMIAGIEKRIFQMPITKDFYTRVVYANEEFELIDNNGKIELNHKIKIIDRGDEIAVYCIHKLIDGNVIVEYMTTDECRHIQKNFAAKNGVWNVMATQMYRKTLVHRYFKHRHFTDKDSEEIRASITKNIEEDFDINKPKENVILGTEGALNQLLNKEQENVNA